MNIKWDRESVLVILMSFMILIGTFYYGNLYLIEPIKEEAELLSDTVQIQKNLLAQYPPEETLKKEYEEIYKSKESFLPKGDQANKELVRLETLAKQSSVNIQSVSRVSNDQPIAEVPDHFVKTAYSIIMTSESSNSFRNLVKRIMEEERIWNVVEFSYNKTGETNYNGTLTYELPYYSEEPEPKNVDDESNTEEELDEEVES